MSNAKTVLVTGCSRGIGLGIVKEYTNRGYKVIATCRRPEQAANLSEFLQANGQPNAFPLDVGSHTSIRECYDQVTKHHAKLDILVNNAGISNKDHPDDLASNTGPEEFEMIMRTNVTGVLHMTQSFLPLLRKSDSPRVINISSALGSLTESPRFSTTSYQCSKAALNMLTKCFAHDAQDVIFVSMHPGWVKKDMGSSKNRVPPVSVEDSAKGILDVAHSVGKEESGIFKGFDGASIKF